VDESEKVTLNVDASIGNLLTQMTVQEKARWCAMVEIAPQEFDAAVAELREKDPAGLLATLVGMMLEERGGGGVAE
jgi:hypothetical protein